MNTIRFEIDGYIITEDHPQEGITLYPWRLQYGHRYMGHYRTFDDALEITRLDAESDRCEDPGQYDNPYP